MQSSTRCQTAARAIERLQNSLAIGALLAGALLSSNSARGAYFPAPESQGGWRSLVPANDVPSAAQKKEVLDRTGLDWDKLAEAWNYIQEFGGTNGLLVIRHGWIAAEWDNLRRPIPIHSCTKSLTGLALAKLFDLSDAGQLAQKIGPESFAYEFLPSTWGQADPRRKLIQIKHLMTMSSGLFAWDGGRDMEGLSRWDFFLTRPVVAAPGKVWAYNSLGVDLLSLIVEKASGQNLQDFFNEKVNAAIGVAPTKWWRKEGHVAGAGGAEFTARNLARVGYLALHGGAWDGGRGVQPVVSAERIRMLGRWPQELANATYDGENSPARIGTGPPHSNLFYAHLWWTNRGKHGLGPTVPEDAYYMSGWGHQICVVIPSLNTVIVRLGKGNENTIIASNKERPVYHELLRRIMTAVVTLPPVKEAVRTATAARLTEAVAAPRYSADSTPASKATVGDVPRWDVYEAALTSTAPHANPFADVTLTATFTHAGSGARLTVDGFYDGDSTWRFRFMPTQTGQWTWITASNVRELDGKTGSFMCVAPTQPHLRGPLHAKGHHFEHADGTTRYLISTRLTCQFADPAVWPGLIALLKEGRINRVLFMMPGVDSKKDPHNTQRTMFAPGPDCTRYNVGRFRAIDAFIDTLRRADIQATPYFYYDPGREVLWKMTPAQDKAYLRYGMARMGAYANLMPCLGNEIELKTTNYKDKAFDLSCHAWINEMGAYLKSRAVFRQPVTVHSPCWQEFAVHPSYFTLLREWPFAGWTDFMLKQAQVGCMGAATALSDGVPQPKAVVYNERSFARHNQLLIDLRKFGQPVINEEPAYDMGSKSAYASQTPETMRPTFWTAATAGAYTMWGSKATYVTGDPLPAMTGSPTVQYMRVHHDVMASLPYREMVPMNEAVSPAHVTIDGEQWRTNFASGKPGEVTLIYSLHGGAGEVALAPGRYTATRIDPRDGARQDLGPVEGGRIGFSLPPGDWVLVYQRMEAVTSSGAPATAGVATWLDDPAAMPGGLIVAGKNPGYLKYNGGGAVFLSGPDEPETFLYLGTLNPDGTRSGGRQSEMIKRLARTGVNAMHCLIFRMQRCNFKKEGDDTHCPFLDHDPARPLNPAVLDQWEGWLTELERAGINVHFEFYNDATDVELMGWKLDAAGNLHPDEHRFISGIVTRFKHHKNLLWGIEESCNKLPRARTPHFKKIGELIARTDNFHHPIVQSFVVPDDPEGDFPPGGVLTDDYVGDPFIRVVTWLHVRPNRTDYEKQHREYLRYAEKDRPRFVTMKNETFQHPRVGEQSRRYMWSCAMTGLHTLEAYHSADDQLEPARRRTPDATLRDDGLIARFMQQTSFHAMYSHDELAAGSTRWVLAQPGEAYIAYTYAYSDAMGLKDLPGGIYDLLWFDTQTGTQVNQPGVSVSGGDTLWAKPATIGNEVALSVKRAGGGRRAFAPGQVSSMGALGHAGTANQRAGTSGATIADRIGRTATGAALRMFQ